MSDVDISAETVRRIADNAEYNDWHVTAATLRALRAALDAAERRAVTAEAFVAARGTALDAALAARDAAWRAGRDAAAVAATSLRHAGTPLCPYGRDKPGDPTWDHTDSDLCPVCKKNGADSVTTCTDTVGGQIAAAIRALQPPADLAAEAPGDAVAKEREACAVIAETMPKPHVESRVSPTGPAWKTPQPDDWPDAIAAAIRARAGA